MQEMFNEEPFYVEGPSETQESILKSKKPDDDTSSLHASSRWRKCR